MALLNYTTYDDVRAALGVTENELSDDTLTLDLYEAHLLADLEDIHVDLDSTHIALESAASTTFLEQRFMRTANTFATYSVAKALTSTLPMFGPKSIEDGKARMDRFNDPYKDTVKAVQAEWERWRKRLQDSFYALGAGSQSAVSRVYFAAVTPSSDPITGT